MPSIFTIVEQILRCRQPHPRPGVKLGIASRETAVESSAAHRDNSNREPKVSKLEDRARELLRRAELTTKARYGAADRLERHHKMSQWTVSLLSTALVFIPIAQALEVSLGTKAMYVNATQAILAVMALVYSLLLGQENFISRSEAMQRNGLELGKFSRELDGMIEGLSIEQYSKMNNKYYEILSKYPNHKPIDYLHTKLSDSPKTRHDAFVFTKNYVKWHILNIVSIGHYLIAISFAGFVLIKLFRSLANQQ